MKPLKALTLLLVLASALCTVEAKPKKPYKLPVMFNQARYIFVESADGQEFDPRVDPIDQQAIADMDEALSHWDRYVVTTRRDEADLIFVVRKGRLGTASVAGRVGSTPQGYPGGRSGQANGVGLGGEVGPPDDLLEVFIRNPDDSRGALLWMRTLTDGLDPPNLTLLKQLKDEVEKSYPSQTASKSKP